VKKYFPLIVVGILVISGLGAVAEIEGEKEQFMTETLMFSNLKIYEEKDYISIELSEATSYSWDKEKPKLPVVTKVYTYPLGTTIDDVQVVLSDIDELTISKPISPSPELFIDSIYVSNEIKKSDNILTYSDIDVYPEIEYSYNTAAGLKGEERVIYLSVNVNPVKYLPKDGTLYYAKSARIDVSYNLPENPVNFPDVYDFLIITAPEFESELERLVEHKNNLNPPVKTVMVTLDDIPGRVGVDTQEDIKYYIKDAIENWNITYVLLVGAGVEGEEIFPVRQAWIKSDEHEDYFPSDLYFADIYNSTMEFSDWDYDEDGIFAEYPRDKPDIDVAPDVYLAKIPCTNVNEVNSYIDKVIYYKQHNKMTKKIVQVGGDSFTEDDVMEGEYANTKVLEKLPGYSTTELWASNGQLTKPNVADGFMSSPDFVDFCGHGSFQSFATHPPKDKDNWIPEKTLLSRWNGFLYIDFDIYRVKNPYKYPVCVYKSCSNSKYSESPTCFSWKTVSIDGGGGIATYAASGISYGATGTGIVNKTTGWMEVKTFERLLSDKILGQVWGASISEYYTTFSSGLKKEDWKTLLEWTLFGDPTLVIEDGDDPKFVRTFNPNFLLRIIESFPTLKMLIRRLNR
jgi:hypothetical protein